MNTAILKKQTGVGSFDLKGEKFLVVKKEYLDELNTLVKSVISGREMLKKGKTRSFSDFLKSCGK